MNSFLKNCWIQARSGESNLFVEVDGDVLCRLDGYAILPRETFEWLRTCAEDSAYREASQVIRGAALAAPTQAGAGDAPALQDVPAPSMVGDAREQWEAIERHIDNSGYSHDLPSDKINAVLYAAPTQAGAGDAVREALTDLLSQVDQFCEVYGEAEFETGRARAALKGANPSSGEPT